MLLSLGALSWRLWAGVSVQTDIRALLPAAELPPALQSAIDQVQEQALDQHLLLLGSRDKARLPQALELVRKSLQGDGVFQVQHWDKQALRSHAVYLQHPYRVIAPSDEKMGAEALAQRALARLYSLSGLTSRTSFSEDPFGVLSTWLNQRPTYSPFSLNGECLYRFEQQRHWCLMQLQANTPGMGLQQTAARVATLDKALLAGTAAIPALQIFDAGVSRHADFAASTAKREFSFISLGTITGIVVLLGLLLRSLSALLTASVVLASGGLLGLSACLLLYPQPHLIALVFGACLLGVAVDYAFHFLCSAGDGTQRLHTIRSGLRLGWLTTSAGFAFLLLAPFDSLRQVAIFAVAGLSGAYLSVVLLLPQLPKRLLSQAPAQLLQTISSHWPAADNANKSILLSLIAALGVSLLLSINLQSKENVRALHAGSVDLLDQEMHARELIDSIDAAQLFIVHGKTDEQLIKTNQALDIELHKAVTQGQLRRFMSISQALPHQAEQQRIYEHWANTIFAAGAALDQLQDQLNLPAQWVATQRQQFASSQPISLSDWHSSPASWPQSDLFIDTNDGEQWAMVRLGGISQLNALHTIAKQLQDSGHDVQFFDPLDAASQGLSSARLAATKVLGFALLAVLVILILRYGIVAGSVSSLPLALAISVCLAGLTIRDQPFSLFCVFALLLVVGMAIDYGLFVREGPANDVHSLLAVSLSAMTTLLAFGLLGFSSTPALKDFGFIVTLGIACAWFSTLLLHRAGWMKKA